MPSAVPAARLYYRAAGIIGDQSFPSLNKQVAPKGGLFSFEGNTLNQSPWGTIQGMALYGEMPCSVF